MIISTKSVRTDEQINFIAARNVRTDGKLILLYVAEDMRSSLFTK